jgi:hypothetical protein
MLVADLNKSGRPILQADWPSLQARKGRQKGRQAGQQGRLSMLIDVPSLTANIFVSAANRTNIDNKTGGVCV